MRIHIKTTDLDLTEPLTRYVNLKIGGLQKFVKRFEKEKEVEIYLELARTTRHHKSGKVFYAEANVEIGGNLIRATHNDENIRAAVDKVKDVLQRDIRKFKEKQVTKQRGR